MSQYTEDNLTNALIEFYREHGDYDPKIEPEAPYDHYGKRGFADLYIELEKLGLSDTMHERIDTKEAHLIEVKSGSAVKSATGANDIIRQFNQMRQNFYKDDGRNTPDPIVETHTGS